MRKTPFSGLLVKFIACLTIIFSVVFLVNSCKKYEDSSKGKTDALTRNVNKVTLSGSIERDAHSNFRYNGIKSNPVIGIPVPVYV